MTELDPTLRELAAAYGVATDFWDWRGQHIDVSHETIVAVLAALGVDASSETEAADALAAHGDAPWRRLLPPCVVVRAGHHSSFDVHVDDGTAVEIELELESGERRAVRQLDHVVMPRELDGRLIGQARFEVATDLPLGYHTIHARTADAVATGTLIVTPAWLGMPERMGKQRAWGLAAQLYTVRSRQSWGFGDLTDLTDLAVWSGAEHDAGFLLINPLAAAEPVPPIEPSPYLPSTRRFVNPLYIRIEQIREFADLGKTAGAELKAIHKALDKSLAKAKVDRIDRDQVWTAKIAALRLVHAVERTAGREIAYRAYVRREGAGLVDFATWCAIGEAHGAVWQNWPAKLRDPRSKAVAKFRAEHASDVDFHQWLQWILDEQLSAAQSAARSAGMALGIMHDLAVGVNPSGADPWAMPDVFAQHVSVGAPPDAFNQAGQDWSQPPLRPDRLAELAYQPFRDVVSTVLRHAGGVRVDHVLGLFRLWWIPVGAEATAGTYVRYDHEAMVGVLALEAHRAGALVVGEDLGTVEPWVRAYLRERGVLGTSILWFEGDYEADGAPLPPERWREYCLASVTTHDLPPTSGYLAGDHVRLRHELGLLTRSLDEELAVDEAERAAWLAELRRRDLLPQDDTGAIADTIADAYDHVEATTAAMHAYLVQTPSRLLSVALTDAVGERRTQNQPGTVDEYPNWRVPLGGPDGKPVLLEDVMTNARAARLIGVVEKI